jgi:hypothetical protein
MEGGLMPNYTRNVWTNAPRAVGDIVQVDGKPYKVLECFHMASPNYYGKRYQLRVLAV